MKFNLNRRKVLTLSVGGAGLLAAGGAGLYFSGLVNPDSIQAAPPSLNPYPFDMPSQATLRASKKKVFGFYYPPYPISIDNKVPSEDHYSSWVSPDGGNGEYRSIGGFTRDRPLPRQKRPESDWLTTDYKTDIRNAIAMGLDGFVYEFPDHQSSDARLNRVTLMLEAAKEVDPDFRIALSIDFPTTAGASPENVAKTILTYKDHPSIYKTPDGRIVNAPFYPERQPLDWWKQVDALVKAGGAQVAFIPIFLSTNLSQFKSWVGITYGLSNWGVRTASTDGNSGSFTSNSTLAHDNKNIWVSPIAAQDMRPNQSNYYEASNSLTLRTTWERTINSNADWAVLMTWNDYSEGTEFAPSTDIQYSIADLTAYYVTWFKTGKKPDITRDVLYYYHRIQPANAKPDTSKQTKVIQLRSSSPAATDNIELLGFLKSPGTLKISIGGKDYQVDANAGMTSLLAPLAAGIPNFNLLRNNSTVINLASIFPVVPSITYQDLLYKGGGSGRAPLITRRFFQMVSRESGMAIDTNNGGAAIDLKQQSPVANQAKQLWTLVAGPDGYYRLQSQSNNLVMDLKANTQGTTITLAALSTASDTQLWQITTAGDGYCSFTNKKSGLTLDVNGASRSAAANIIQWPYHGKPNQQWKLQVV